MADRDPLEGLSIEEINAALISMGQQPIGQTNDVSVVQSPQATPDGGMSPAPMATTAPDRPAIRTIEPPSANNGYNARERGNIDLTRRPQVQNPDGSVSTVRSMGVNIDGKEVLLPTVSPDGRIMSDEQAVDAYRRTGQHLGVYASPEGSNQAAEAIHRDQESYYSTRSPTMDAPERHSSVAEYRRDQDTDDDLRVQNAGKEFEASARGAQRQGDVYGQLRAEQQSIVADTDKRVAQHNKREDRFMRDSDRAYQEYVDLLNQQPRADIAGAIFGMLAQAASGPGGDRGFGALMGGISNMIGSDVQRLAFLRDAKGKELAAAMDMLGSAESSEEHDLRAGAALLNIHAAPYDAALKQIEKETDVEGFKVMAERARLDLRAKLRDAYVQQWQASQPPKPKPLTTEELLKQQKTLAEINKLREEQGLPPLTLSSSGQISEGERPSGGEGPAGYPITNTERFRKTDPVTRRKFGESAAVVKTLNQEINLLKQDLQKYGTESNWDRGMLSSDEAEKAARRMKSRALKIKLGMKNAESMGAWDKGTADIMNEMIGDPNSLLDSGDAVIETLDTVQEGLNSAHRNSADAIGLGLPESNTRNEQGATATGRPATQYGIDTSKEPARPAATPLRAAQPPDPFGGGR